MHVYVCVCHDDTIMTMIDVILATARHSTQHVTAHGAPLHIGALHCTALHAPALDVSLSDSIFPPQFHSTSADSPVTAFVSTLLRTADPPLDEGYTTSVTVYVGGPRVSREWCESFELADVALCGCAE